MHGIKGSVLLELQRRFFNPKLGPPVLHDEINGSRYFKVPHRLPTRKGVNICLSEIVYAIYHI